MAARFILCPGWVTSKTDGGSHYISASHLAMLYGLKQGDFYVEQGNFKLRSPLPRLYPRFDGNYTLPESK